MQTKFSLLELWRLDKAKWTFIVTNPVDFLTLLESNASLGQMICLDRSNVQPRACRYLLSDQRTFKVLLIHRMINFNINYWLLWWLLRLLMCTVNLLRVYFVDNFKLNNFIFVRLTAFYDSWMVLFVSVTL